ncbi:hypothetical protein ACHMW7_05040 [Aminobacter sp. UC22_36]|uniref:hypothetical protein n=1 Tax=Aminobacter sp. UC22_36 TaxID=3374549 RepID=UPI0037564AD9
MSGRRFCLKGKGCGEFKTKALPAPIRRFNRKMTGQSVVRLDECADAPNHWACAAEPFRSGGVTDLDQLAK